VWKILTSDCITILVKKNSESLQIFYFLFTLVQVRSQSELNEQGSSSANVSPDAGDINYITASIRNLKLNWRFPCLWLRKWLCDQTLPETVTHIVSRAIHPAQISKSKLYRAVWNGTHMFSIILFRSRLSGDTLVLGICWSWKHGPIWILTSLIWNSRIKLLRLWLWIFLLKK
jgi:hypothetical protein